MAKFFRLLVLVALVGGGVFFFVRFKVELHRGVDGKVDSVRVLPRQKQSDRFLMEQASSSDLPPILVASFSLRDLDAARLANRRVNDVLVKLLSRFDVVAVQDIEATSQGALQQLVEQINAEGRNYNFAVSWEVEQDAVGQYSAFVFDQATVEVGAEGAISLDTQQPPLRHKPLVAQFRVRGPQPAQAFTFKLVNVNLDPDQADRELPLLSAIYRAVRDDGTNEDDVIVLGNFGAGDDRVAAAAGPHRLTSSLDPRRGGPRRVENILFDRQATVEFTGRSDVFDLAEEFEIPAREAQEFSSHVPVWAEFSRYEGGQSGHVAATAAISAD